jgi:hypothetical protein
MPIPENVRGTGDFRAHPENINRKGRPPSIKKQLKEILQKDGEFAMPEKLLLRTEVKEGETYYIFKMPTEKAIANKLISLAMRSNVTGLRAIQMIMEQIDGKPHQSITTDTKNSDPIKIIVENARDKDK